MLNLIKKEIALCMHPTAFIFLFFAVLVFVPNYPYEVIFFFSCLSIFFCCMMTRENGDIAFSCALPVKKEHIPFAKMLVVFGLQCIILLLVGVIGAIKGAVLPAEQYVNQAGISTNLVLVGNGAILLGTFNLIFFPCYFKKPDKIGVPYITQFSIWHSYILIYLCYCLLRTFPTYLSRKKSRNQAMFYA